MEAGQVESGQAGFLSPVEDRLRIAARAASIGIWEWNLRTGEMEFSSVGRRIFGFSESEPITIDMVRAVTHPDDLPWTSALSRRATDPALGERPIYRYRFIRADTGEVRWGLAYGEAQFDEVEGRRVARSYIGTIQDITEVQIAEQALADSEARLRLAIDIGEIAVWEVDPATDTVTGSPELNRLCGFPEDANPSLAEFRSRFAPGEVDRISREGEAMAERGETRLQTEFKLVLPDGSEKWMLLRAQAAPGAAVPGGRVIGALIDITERKRQEERLATVAQELRHRVKNSLAVVNAIAARTLHGDDPEAAYAAFSARLQAISRATDIVLSRVEEAASLEELSHAVLAPYRDRETFVIGGPEVSLSGKTATAVGLALHELATNAVKYGALSVPDGRVRLGWRHDGDGSLRVSWSEHGGPPVTPPTRNGFGTQLLRRGLVAPPDRVELSFPAEGVRCEIVLRPEGGRPADQ